jgi:hypothetical protein
VQKVIVLGIGSCSADLHKDLAGMNLKLKFRVKGNTYLKSKARKTSIGADDELKINFNSMHGDAIYEGGELFQFELCRVGLFSSSQTLASCAVRAKNVFASIGNSTEGAVLNLELVALDTPSHIGKHHGAHWPKVLANLTVHIAFRTATLDEVGGLRMLKSLKFPTKPDPDSVAVSDFIYRAREVADRLKVVHDLTMEAIAALPRDAPQSNQHMKMADDVSTSSGNSSSGKPSLESFTTEVV